MKKLCKIYKAQVIKLWKLFYAFELDKKDRKRIFKSLRENNPFWGAYSLDPDYVDEELFELIGGMFDFQKIEQP